MSIKRIGTLVVAALLVVLLSPSPATASEVMKVSEDRWLVSDQSTTSFSGTGSMRRKVMRVAASLCEGLEFRWMLPLNQESTGGSFWSESNPSSSMEVLFFGDQREAEEKAAALNLPDPIECQPLAEAKIKRKLLRKLDRRGDI